MREILFRGRRVDNDTWIYGDLRHWRNGTVGIHSDALQKTLPVIPETVGQDTDMADKNGMRIFEGDIVRIESEIFELTGYVAFEHGCFQLIDPACDVYECLWYQPYEMTVLGNIHDNPELLEVEG